MSFGALQKLHDMQNRLTTQPALDVTVGDGPGVYGNSAGTEQEHAEHLEAFRCFLEAAAVGQVSVSVFTSTLVQAAEVVRRDNASFSRQVARRPGLAAVADAWLELNELTLEAYVQARHFTESGNPADLDEALAMLEDVLEARTACYPYFE